MSKEDYCVLNSIGTGSFGSVSKVKRKSDDKVLVWKEINFGKMSEKEKPKSADRGKMSYTREISACG